MESCGMQTAKYLLFAFNLIFALSGIAIIAVGGVVLADISDYGTFMESRVTGPPIVLIVVGSIVFLVASLGCCGAITENKVMLIMYAALLLIIFIIEFAVGITAAATKTNFNAALKTEMTNSMKQYTNSSTQKEAWNKLQQKFECCGVNNYTDWLNIVKPDLVPKSCCKKGQKEDCLTNTYSSNPTFYTQGCNSKMENLVQKSVVAIAAVGLGIAFIEWAGIILALCLVQAIRSQEK